LAVSVVPAQIASSTLYISVTTERNRRERPAPDLVNRRFVADAPNQFCVADMTYIPTWAGFVYLAMVLDACSRRVVGWAMGEEMTAELVVPALNMALATRKPESTIPTKAASTPAWPSAAVARRPTKTTIGKKIAESLQVWPTAGRRQAIRPTRHLDLRVALAPSRISFDWVVPLVPDHLPKGFAQGTLKGNNSILEEPWARIDLC